MSSRRDRESVRRPLLTLLVCGCLAFVGIQDQRSIAWGDEHDRAFDFLATNLTIFSAADRHIIGHGRYSSSMSDGTVLIRGENKYLDGARDLELDYLKPGDSGEAPTLVHHEYSSFNADGTPQFVESFDPATGAASCADNVNGVNKVYEGHPRGAI